MNLWWRIEFNIQDLIQSFIVVTRIFIHYTALMLLFVTISLVLDLLLGTTLGYWQEPVVFWLLFYLHLKQSIEVYRKPLCGLRLCFMIRELCWSCFPNATSCRCHQLLQDAWLLVLSFAWVQVQYIRREENLYVDYTVSEGYLLVSKIMWQENFPHRFVNLRTEWCFQV